MRNTVLIVEDDDSIGALLGIMVTQLGLQGVHRCDGASCLRWFAENHGRVALVVLDCSLPDASGGSVAHGLRAVAPGCPLLFISGRPCPGQVQALAAEGPADFMPKPFRPGEVVTRIRRLICSGVAA